VYLKDLDGDSAALAGSLEQTFFVTFRRKRKAYAVKLRIDVRIDDPALT